MLKRTFWFILVDFITSFFSWLTFYYLRKVVLNEYIEIEILSIINGLILASVWVTIFIITGRYKNLYHKSRVSEVFETAKTVIITAIILFFIILLDDEGVKHYKDYYKVFFLFLIIHLLAFILFKSLCLSYAKSLVQKNKVIFNTIIIGSNKRSIEFIDQIETAKTELGLNFVGYIHLHDKNQSYLKDSMRHWGGINQLRTVIRRCNISQIIISLDPSEHKEITNLLSLINTNQIKVSIIPDTYHLLLRSVGVNHILGVPLIDIKQEIMPLWQRIIKRGMDLAISLIVLIIGSPFFILFMALTKSSSKGPIFYTQLRVGKDERFFNIYKFRCMYVGSEKE